MKSFALILVVILINVTAQLIIKTAMEAQGETFLSLQSLPSLAIRLFTTPRIILGLALYATGAFLWMIVLSRLDLSLAYPMVSLSYILLAFLAWLLLDEPLTLPKLAGTVVICAGVFIITR